LNIMEGFYIIFKL